MIKVNGRTKEIDPTIPEVDDPQIYTLDVIYCDGDLILKNGSYTKNSSGSQVSKTVDGLTKSSSTWSVGKYNSSKPTDSKVSDPNNNIVVLKVNGNLTLEAGYTLTSIKANTTDVAKGLFIYCTGTATINGTINMSGVTCTAEGKNVYIWKNNDGSFEYIRKDGGEGGAGKKVGKGYEYSYTVTLGNGNTYTETDNHWITGGGAGGNTDYRTSSYSVHVEESSGSIGTSWVGGKGGDAKSHWHTGTTDIVGTRSSWKRRSLCFSWWND